MGPIEGEDRSFARRILLAPSAAGFIKIEAALLRFERIYLSFIVSLHVCVDIVYYAERRIKCSGAVSCAGCPGIRIYFFFSVRRCFLMSGDEMEGYLD